LCNSGVSGAKFRPVSAYRVKYLVSTQAAVLFGSVCSYEVCTKGFLAVYGTIGVRERISTRNFSVRCLVHKLTQSQRGNTECADLRSAGHLAYVYTHTRNARNHDALSYVF
jgi:hypothetical protein